MLLAYLGGRCKEGRVSLFSVVPSDWARINGNKMKLRRFPWNIRKHFVRMTEHLDKLFWNVVESPSLEVSKSCLDMLLAACSR